MKSDAPFGEVVPWVVAIGIFAMAIIGNVTWYFEGYQTVTYESRYNIAFGKVVGANTCYVSTRVVVPREEWWEIYFPRRPKHRHCSFVYGISGGQAQVQVLKGKKHTTYTISPGKEVELGTFRRAWIRRAGSEPVTFYIQYYDNWASPPATPIQPDALIGEVSWLGDSKADPTAPRPDGTVEYVQVPYCRDGWSKMVQLPRAVRWKFMPRVQELSAGGEWVKDTDNSSSAVRFCSTHGRSAGLQPLYWEGEPGFEKPQKQKQGRKRFELLKIR